jgi:hypothetical protein
MGRRQETDVGIALAISIGVPPTLVHRSYGRQYHWAAYGFYNVKSLANYEAYRARLSADPLGKRNYEFAQKEKFLLREDRMFLKLASAPNGDAT